jgi:hypothetical protein
MDGIWTQEAIIDTTHGRGFLCEATPSLAELNAWYHMMNCALHGARRRN